MTKKGLQLVLTWLVLTSLLSACATQKSKEQAELHLRIGSTLLQQGKYPDALRELLEAEKLDPANAYIENNLGLAYFLRAHYTTAEQHFKRALQIDPKYTEARNNDARALIEMDRSDEAIRELKSVLDDLTYAEPQRAWVNLGLAYFRKNDFTQAKDAFAQAIKIDRNHCLAQTMYGRSLLEMKDYPQAAQSLDRAGVICKADNFDEPSYFAGLAYYRLGKTEDAISRMEDVVKKYPDSRYAKKAGELLQIMR